MKKVILMAAVAMLFVGTAAAQGKVTKTNSGVSTSTTATVAKPDQGPKANQAQGQATAGKKDLKGTSINGCNKPCNNHAKEGANCNKPCNAKKDNTSTTIKNTNVATGKDNKVQK